MSLITTILNRTTGFVLDLDPDGKERFQALQGKLIRIEMTNTDLMLDFSPGTEGLNIALGSNPVEQNPKMTDSISEPDVILSGSLASFVQLAKEGLHGGTFSSGKIQIQGDVETGQAFQKAITGFDLDWEEFISRFIGDTPARKVGLVAREFGNWAEETMNYSRENLSDYLKEEKRWLPSEPAMQQFQKNVSELRADVDRLEKRIQRLNRTLDAGATGSE